MSKMPRINSERDKIKVHIDRVLENHQKLQRISKSLNRKSLENLVSLDISNPMQLHTLKSGSVQEIKTNSSREYTLQSEKFIQLLKTKRLLLQITTYFIKADKLKELPDLTKFLLTQQNLREPNLHRQTLEPNKK